MTGVGTVLADDPHALVGERVAIIGAGGIGTDIAHMLSEHDGFYERYGFEGPDTSLYGMYLKKW